MCLERKYPPDIRVEKEAKALTKTGHEVFILSLRQTGSPDEEKQGNITILRYIPQPSFPIRVWNLFWLSVFGVHPIWKIYIAESVTKWNIEAIHVHDLPLVYTGLKVARKRNLPLIADLHENYPQAIKYYNTSFKDKLANIILPPKRWEKFEKSWLKQADKIVTVIDEMKQRLEKDYCLDSEKITVVMNVEDIEAFLALPIRYDIITRYEQYYTILYVGGFGQHRGIQTAISAMPRIISEIPEARLVLVGSGGNETELKEIVRNMNLTEHVEFTGQEPFENVPSFISASDVCLVPYVTSVQTNASSPHKLIQYMALGKPVITSSMESLSRIISETGAGLVFIAEDETSLATQVINVYKDKDLADRLGRAGLIAAKTKYNMEVEGRKLIQLYRSLENQ